MDLNQRPLIPMMSALSDCATPLPDSGQTPAIGKIFIGKFMRLAFYGNSMCSRNSEKFPNFKLFIDQISATYPNASIESSAVSSCSEERLLHLVKKSNDLDLVVIFHGEPGFIFFPTFNRDTHKRDQHEFDYDLDFEYIPDARNDKKLDMDTKFETISPEERKNLITIYQKYFYTPETNRNRFYGALIQLEQYLNYKNIKAIHCPQHKHNIPKWFQFTSGPVLYDIAPMQHGHSVYSCSYNLSPNAVTQEGNDIIFEKLNSEIKKLLNLS